MNKTPVRKRERVRSKKRLTKRREQVLVLRKKGRTNQEIAQALGISYQTVASDVHRLVAEGRVQRQRRGMYISPLEKERRRQVVTKMTREGFTLTEIGAVLKLSGVRVSQLKKEIIKENGKKILTPDEPLWTLQEAADLLGTTRRTVRTICAEHSIRLRKYDGRTHQISKAGMKTLKECYKRLLATRTKACAVCDNLFTATTQKQIICSSKKCRWEMVRRRHEAGKMPDTDSLLAWRKDLWEKLRSHRLPENEEWMGIGEAARRTGLSKMQLTWLRMCNIVTIRYDPTRIAFNTGKPSTLYAASEMEVARQVFKAYNRSRKKEPQIP